MINREAALEERIAALEEALKRAYKDARCKANLTEPNTTYVNGWAERTGPHPPMAHDAERATRDGLRGNPALLIDN